MPLMISDTITKAIPYATQLWTAYVDVGQRQYLGQNKNGTRYLIPIIVVILQVRQGLKRHFQETLSQEVLTDSLSALTVLKNWMRFMICVSQTAQF